MGIPIATERIEHHYHRRICVQVANQRSCDSEVSEDSGLDAGPGSLLVQVSLVKSTLPGKA